MHRDRATGPPLKSFLFDDAFAGDGAPLTDALDEFFLVVDYRMLSTGLTAFAVLLVVVGALIPQEHNLADDDADKKKED